MLDPRVVAELNRLGDVVVEVEDQQVQQSPVLAFRDIIQQLIVLPNEVDWPDFIVQD